MSRGWIRAFFCIFVFVSSLCSSSFVFSSTGAFAFSAFSQVANTKVVWLRDLGILRRLLFQEAAPVHEGVLYLDRRLTPPQRKSNPQGFSQVCGPKIGQDDHSSSTSSSSAMDSSELEKSLEEGDEEPPVPEAIPPMASSQVKTEMDKWIDRICGAIGVSPDEALFFYLEGHNWDFEAAVEGCSSKTLPPVKETSSIQLPSSPEHPSGLDNDIVSTFCRVGGPTREEAIDCLKNFDWNYERAMAYFICEDNRRISNQLPNSPEQPSYQLKSERMAAFFEFAVEASQEDAMDCLKRCDWDVNTAISYFFERSQSQASHGSRNQGYLREGEIGRSSSSIKAEPNETGNVTVASPGTASSQVDGKLKGKAVKEHSSTEMVYVPPVAIQDRMILGPRDGVSGTAVEIRPNRQRHPQCH